ncbi:hypothetical protein FEM48_Zijuj07G0084800 [Ziziphus jujuba var. spinosa]|uniref:Transmembrane protein n=1 Tax=Ziziphus jujuba var. spinosa TaxID=714518 RepID=A0A978V3K2_ZIZJJ|nr:hypothetical protein FEM48_Zijuj07G0084800 [Ziziphus jujuba var. spinosa]
MEGYQQAWRPRLSFKNATILVCLMNLITVLLLLQGFLSSSSSSSSRSKFSSSEFNSGSFLSLSLSLSLSLCADRFSQFELKFQTAVQLRYIRESEEIRLAMQPLELIKRVKEIQKEAYAEPERVQEKDVKQTAAAGLSKRLKDLRSLNDAASLKALEEWRKRKMERDRLRQLEKNGTAISQS